MESDTQVVRAAVLLDELLARVQVSSSSEQASSSGGRGTWTRQPQRPVVVAQVKGSEAAESLSYTCGSRVQAVPTKQASSPLCRLGGWVGARGSACHCRHMPRRFPVATAAQRLASLASLFGAVSCSRRLHTQGRLVANGCRHRVWGPRDSTLTKTLGNPSKNINRHLRRSTRSVWRTW